jgi:hypothetical protein
MAKATATPANDGSALLLAAAFAGSNNGSIFSRAFAMAEDAVTTTLDGTTELIGKAFGAMPDTYTASTAAGTLRGIGNAQRILASEAKRNGWTPEYAAQLLAVRNGASAT